MRFILPWYQNQKQKHKRNYRPYFLWMEMQKLSVKHWQTKSSDILHRLHTMVIRLNSENEVGLTPENQLMLSIISTDAENYWSKSTNQKLFHGKKKKKNFKRLTTEGNFQLGKGASMRFTYAIMLNSETVKAFPLRLGNKTRISILITSMQHHLWRFYPPWIESMSENYI